MKLCPSDTAEYVKQAKPIDLEAAKDLAVSHSGHHVSRCNNYPSEPNIEKNMRGSY
jgi:hypothetical protein